MTALRPLHPYQERALESLRASLAAGERRPIVALPTGASKTRLAAEITRRRVIDSVRVAALKYRELKNLLSFQALAPVETEAA